MSLSLLMFLSLSGTYVFFRLRADFISMFGKDITGTDVLVSLCQFCCCLVGVSIRMFWQFRTNFSKIAELPPINE